MEAEESSAQSTYWVWVNEWQSKDNKIQWEKKARKIKYSQGILKAIEAEKTETNQFKSD